ncbi:MAG: DUF58 domain-containing protein [Candidatus Aureabacteria bacterium]|nr:DUF58 domain-containing protein [Candidatus Auribacterota bacterium]
MDKTIFSKVKRIQIKTSKMITEMFSGDYRSVFKGRGMEFEEVREYIPGDEIRTIDWNVTARMGKPFVKLFKEERELTVFFVVDVSSSMDFGSSDRSKKELVAELCAVLAFTAIKNNDKVGLLLFSDHVEKYIRPEKGKKHVLRVIRELLAAGTDAKKTRRKTDLTGALEYFYQTQTKKAVCFVVSDFFTTGYDSMLNILTKKHDLIVVQVADRLEKEFPSSGIVSFEDLENKRQVLVDFSNPATLMEFREKMKQRREGILKRFHSKGIDCLTLETGEDYLKTLNFFFKEREKRLRR